MPGGAIVGDSAEGVPAKGATRPNHDTVQGHDGKFEGMAEFVWTPTQVTGILVDRTSSLSVRRL